MTRDEADRAVAAAITARACALAADAPSLTDEQRHRLRVLLNPPATTNGGPTRPPRVLTDIAPAAAQLAGGRRGQE